MCLSASAEDLTTRDGKLFRNIEVTALEGDRITVKHGEGVTVLSLRELPDEFQKRYSAAELFKQLQQAQKELQRLQGDLGSAKNEIKKAAVAAQESVDRNRAVRPERHAPELATLAPLQSSDVVEVSDLVEHYAMDPKAADQRYRKKTFQARGTVISFGSTLFLRSYVVELDTRERQRRVVCHFPYPDEFRSVTPRESGAQLVAALVPGGERLLARKGEVIAIRGTFSGLDDGTLVFRGCRRVQ